MTSFERYRRDEWDVVMCTCFCWKCGRYLHQTKGGAAHIIADTKSNNDRYGKWVLAHRDNLVAACNGACNDAAMALAKGPAEKDALARKIIGRIFSDIERGGYSYIGASVLNSLEAARKKIDGENNVSQGYPVGFREEQK